MSIVQVFKRSLSAKVALKLTAVLLVVTALAATVIMLHQSRRMEEETLEKAKLAAKIGARQYGDVLDNAIDNGLISVNDAFDRNYVEIKGYNWGKKPKFHSKYDVITDRAVLAFQDKIIEDPDFVFAIGVDNNGYLPTHNSKFQEPVTNDPEKDLLGNRSKYMANHPMGMIAAKNLEPTLVQVYKRDTGETMWDVTSPIFVKGKHWGAFRIAVSMDRISADQRSLLLTLFGVFLIFLVAAVGTTYLVLRLAMRPVVALTAAAEQISLGEELEKSIKSTDIDEIGLLTKSVDRMRVSMKAALSRLGQ